MRFPLMVSFLLALAATGPARANAGGPEPAPVRVFLEQQGFVTFKLTKLQTGHEIIEGVLNGVSGTFVLDSGAGATVLHKDRLAKFEIASATAQEEGAGAGGAVTITAHDVTSLTLGGKSVPLLTIYSTDLASVVSRLQTVTGIEIDGVIGQDVPQRHARPAHNRHLCQRPLEANTGRAVAL